MSGRLRRRLLRSSRVSSSGRQHFNKVGAWLAAVLAAAVAAALTGVLTGAFDALGRAITGGTSEADPLTISVGPLMTPCPGSVVVPQPPAQLKTSYPGDLSTMRSWPDWPPARTGVGASPDRVPIFVQGRSNAEVILTGLRVRVHERRPPLAGTSLGAACGDLGEFRWLEVDLDHNPPRPLPIYDPVVAEIAKRYHGAPDWRLQPIQFPYKVSVSEAESFLIVANTEGCDCTWDMELTWATQGRTGTSVINNNGMPFRTTSTRDTVGSCMLATAEVYCE